MLHFKNHKNSNYDILDWLDKSKLPCHGGFPLADLHFAESVDVVPASNLWNLFKIIAHFIWQS